MAIGDGVDQQRRGGAWARIIVLVPVFLLAIVFGLRGVGFRDGPSTREVTVHTNGPGGAADFVALESGNPADGRSIATVSDAAVQACTWPTGVLKALLGFRGAKAVFVTEVIPSGNTARFRWDCRLRVLRMADQAHGRLNVAHS